MTTQELKEKYYSEKSVRWHQGINDYANWLEDALIESANRQGGSTVWLVRDSSGDILSAHSTESAAQKERESLRGRYSARVDFFVSSVVVSESSN